LHLQPFSYLPHSFQPFPISTVIALDWYGILHSDIRVERLLYVIENFFSLGDIAYHELGLYFSIVFVDDSMYDKQRTFLVQDANIQFIFQWIPLHTLENVPVYPLCLQKVLQSIPETTQHIVHFDG